MREPRDPLLKVVIVITSKDIVYREKIPRKKSAIDRCQTKRRLKIISSWARENKRNSSRRHEGRGH